MVRTQKILIVDDKPENLHALKTVLQCLDVQIVEALNGNDALIATLNHEFALSILDVQMPEMDGYELAGYMREEERTKYVPIIFLSAIYSEDFHIFKGYESGAVDFITKPYKSELLVSKVKAFLEFDEQRHQLKKARNIAESANRAKSAFLANMSHELRTPLHHILGFTELVVDKTVGELNETQSEYLEHVLSSSRHLLSLIDNILDISNIESATIDLETRETDLTCLLEESFIMMGEEAGKKNIALVKDLENLPETVEVDESRLKQVIYNLLSNAVKFTPEGGSVVLGAHGVSLVNGHFARGDGHKIVLPKNSETALNDHRNFVEISVSDTGIGLSNNDMEIIFNSFEQADDSTSRAYQGAGLGLSLNKRLVELHNGAIWAESEGEGKGSTFRIVLPV